MGSLRVLIRRCSFFAHIGAVSGVMPFTKATGTEAGKKVLANKDKTAMVSAAKTVAACEARKRRVSEPPAPTSPLPAVTPAAPPASAPAPRSRPAPEALAYDPLGHIMFCSRHHTDVREAAAAEAAEAAAKARVEHEVGHSIWDDRVLGRGVEELTTLPCPGCAVVCGVKLVGNLARGAGGGALLFQCRECATERPLVRSEVLDTGKRGRPADANTQRVVSAFMLGGNGLQGAPPPSSRVRAWTSRVSLKCGLRLLPVASPLYYCISDLLFLFNFALSCGCPCLETTPTCTSTLQEAALRAEEEAPGPQQG